MPGADGIYICPVCRKQYYGDLAAKFACNGVREVQHQPVMVEQTHHRVGPDSFAPLRLWS
jgi:hypothetical protein